MPIEKPNQNCECLSQTEKDSELRVDIKLRVKPDGTICGLWDDEAYLQSLGECHIRRASHIEYDNSLGLWVVTTTGIRRKVLAMANSRSEALAWELEYFKPGGPGWNLLDRKAKWQQLFEQLLAPVCWLKRLVSLLVRRLM
jgi:hypothetical protein